MATTSRSTLETGSSWAAKPQPESQKLLWRMQVTSHERDFFTGRQKGRRFDGSERLRRAPRNQTRGRQRAPHSGLLRLLSFCLPVKFRDSLCQVHTTKSVQPSGSRPQNYPSHKQTGGLATVRPLKQRPHQQNRRCHVVMSEPVVFHHGREGGVTGHDEVRPSAATACSCLVSEDFGRVRAPGSFFEGI